MYGNRRSSSDPSGRSAPEGGRSPRMLRTRPPLGFPPSRWKSPARSPPSALPVAAADPCPAAEGAGHPVPRRRDPDGPRGTLPARLRTAVSPAFATAPVLPPPPPPLPALRENAAAPDGPSCAPAGTGGFIPRRPSRRRFRRRRPRTPSTPKPQIPTRTGPCRRHRSSGEPVRMLPRNQSPELATALGGCSRKAPDGRGPRRRLPTAGSCSPRAVEVVRASFRSRPLLPASKVFAGPLPSPSGVASPHPWNRIVRIRCPWPLSLRRRAPGPRASVTACALPKPAQPVRSERAAQPVPSFPSDLGSQRSGAHPVPGPVNEQRLAVKIGRRVEPGIPAGWRPRCM